MKGRVMAHFLKPVGTKEKNMAEEEGAVDTKRVEFAKGREPKIREGHILILFASGSQKLITYLSVVSKIQHNPENEDFPYFVHTKDWAPEYSKKWWTYNNTLGSLASAHLAANPTNKLAATKVLNETTFATFIYGKSSLELNTDFAYSLINTIKAGGK